jgi:site-specific DNA recombinase
MIKAAIYARVSSKAQRDANTIENQLLVLRPFVAARNMKVVEEYLDDGRSAQTGKLGKRDGFARLLEAAKAKRFEVLVTAAMDRLTRTEDLIELAEILGPFQRLGVPIVSPSLGDIDLRTMSGLMMAMFHSQAAAEENRRRGERIKAGKLRAISNNRKPAGPTPFGFTYDRATGDWSIDEPAAELLREMIRRVANGETCVAIADDFIRRGVRAPGRGKPWTRGTVYRLIHTRYVCGEWTVNKNTGATIALPRIVSDEEWNAAQVQLRRAQRRGLNRTQHVYLLQSFATCGHCGEPIVIRSGVKYFNAAREAREHPSAYLCRGRMAKPRRCEAPIIYTKELDARVWAKISERLAHPDLVRELAEVATARASDARDWSADAEGYRAHLERLTRVETTITLAYRNDRLSESVFAEQLEGVLRERKMVREQLATAEHASKANLSAKDRLRLASASLEALRSALPKATPEQRRSLLHELVRDGGVVIRDGQAHLDLRLVRRAAAGSRGAAGGGPIGVVPSSD